MKFQTHLIEGKGYVAVSDEEIKLSDWFYHPNKALAYQFERAILFTKNEDISIINGFNAFICKKIIATDNSFKLEGIPQFPLTSIPESQWGVHETHCCLSHGCKYGEEDICPVHLGLIKQKYECGWGKDSGEDCFNPENNFKYTKEDLLKAITQVAYEVREKGYGGHSVASAYARWWLGNSLKSLKQPKKLIGIEVEEDKSQAYYKSLDGLKIDSIFLLPDAGYVDIGCKGGGMKRNTPLSDIIYPMKITNGLLTVTKYIYE